MHKPYHSQGSHIYIKFILQNNLNYVICIKRQWDYCSVTYSNEAENAEYEFQLINVDAGKID